MASLLTFLGVIGHWIAGRWDGVLIDDRNRIGLSRFQVTVWTVVIIPAIAAAAVANVISGQSNPLDLNIPQQIWVALGIATTSVVASPLLLASKAPAVIARKAAIAEASWTDLFKGEDATNSNRVDMARVQMFFFTLVLVVVYGAALAKLFFGAKSVVSFPDFDSSMAALLGISNAGYLVNKAVPH